MSSLKYHAEFLELIASQPPAAPPEPVNDIYALQKQNTGMLAQWAASFTRPDKVQTDEIKLASYDGTEIELVRHTTADSVNSPTPLPAVFQIHGGGMIANSPDRFDARLAGLARDCGFPVFAVQYRLAPQHPAPTPAEDCYAALKYLLEHAAEFNVDPTKIVVMGDSAGGGLAASLTLLARDRQLTPPIARQVLIYPMLDDRTDMEPDSALRPLLTWSPEYNAMTWKAYVGEDKRGGPDVSPYAAPARAEDLRGLPPAYIDVGSLDLFRDEDIAYAGKLAKADVDVELHVWPGVPHGFDGPMSKTKLGQTVHDLRVKAIKSVLN